MTSVPTIETITAALGIGLAAGAAIGWVAASRRMPQVLNSLARSKNGNAASNSISSSGPDVTSFSDYGNSEYKLVILLRTDLEIGKGKIAAQCCHAAVGAYEKLNKTAEGQQVLKRWRQHGQPKIVLKVSSESELTELAQQAKAVGLPTSLIADAGRTQIASGTLTVCGIGPAPKQLIDKVTGHLKLY